MSASKIPRNWKDIVKKYYFLEILVEGLRTDRSLSSSQNSKNTKDYKGQYLTIISLANNNEIGWKSQNYNSLTISVSKDGKTWTEYTSAYQGTPIATLKEGEKLYIKGTNSAYGGQYENYTSFTSTENFNVEGNVMSMLYGDDFIEQTTLNSYAFKGLFKSSQIISAENLILPSTVLANGCYSNMFSSCYKLTKIPKLKGTTLASYCYEKMFFIF